MTIRNTYAAEAWDKVYNAFQQINFTAYDYDTIKESLLQYLKIYHAEHFNDFIESSEMIAMLELFAYVAELLAYRVDIASHENFITTAQRKQSILKLARLISYRASRNIPARGLVKLTSIRTSEQVFDSLGNDLSNSTILWNDPNNTNWKEQFFLVMNKVLTTKFGQPQKSFQVGDVLMQLYAFNHEDNAFSNGVYPFSASGTIDQIPMEIVPADVDENGPYERAPDLNSQLSIIYASDGRGDSSDYTGFLMFVKQGSLIRTDYFIEVPTANRRIELDIVGVNDTDVWVYRVDDSKRITEIWNRVETLNEQNLAFNDDTGTRKKFEVETLENDKIALIFGDGNFSDSPVGTFQFWTRSSLNQNISIPKNRIIDQQMAFTYIAKNNFSQSFNLGFALTSAIQNNSASETIEHVRQAAPATYYAQNRMVNGQDYNTYMLKDQSLLKLKTINRTFAGQPKFIEWNDASRKYENIKLFGDDLIMYHEMKLGQIETTLSSRLLADGFIENLLLETGVYNSLTHVLATHDGGYGIIYSPRRKFIEDNQAIYKKVDGTNIDMYGDSPPGALNEKSAIQAALDRHWYGEPLRFVLIGGVTHGVIPDVVIDPTSDGKLYDNKLPRTIDGVNTYPPGDIGSGLQSIGNMKYFGLKFNPFASAIGDGVFELMGLSAPGTSYGDGPMEIPEVKAATDYPKRVEVFTIALQSDRTTFSVISNIRGVQPSYTLLNTSQVSYAEQNPSALINFKITQGTIDFMPGDGFVIDVKREESSPSVFEWFANIREIQSTRKLNFNGWWEIIKETDLQANGIFDTPNESGPNFVQTLDFDPNHPVKSWILLVAREDDTFGNPASWKLFYRDMKLIVESPATKFWYNQNIQITDPETLKPVTDKIRILRTNLDAEGKPLLKNQIYDILGFVYDSDGNINFNALEVLPTDKDGFTTAGNALPDNPLQFHEFAKNSYEFFIIDSTDAANPVFLDYLGCDDFEIISLGYDEDDYEEYDYDTFIIKVFGLNLYEFSFEPGELISTEEYEINGVLYRIGRRLKVPAPVLFDSVSPATICNDDTGLDFMWQHFSPITHLIDPSVTNIHDAFIITRGYYNDVINFVKGFNSEMPTPPTPLELRTAYGYLLQNKMLSDTVVLHSGQIKLLFGSLAEPQLRAKFRVIKAPAATFSDERIKFEIVSIIDTYFDIQNWDFGDRFFATELISLIHQRLSTQIASVVLVPTYSVNYFGSLFTIDSGYDEVLQSCATVDDIEMVDALTPTVLRQYR